VELLRLETVEIRADAGPIDGQFRGIATLAKPGVYAYSDGVNQWTEYTPPETLADVAYMDSLRMMPVTLDHPSPPVVTSANVKALAVGGMGDTVTVDADGILSQPIAVWDATAAQAARSTHKQISLGYRALIDPNPGVTPDGYKYDRKQVKRLANHVALVEEGRHGPRIRVRADGSDNVAEQHQFAERVDGVGNLPSTLDKLTDRSATTLETTHMAQITLGNIKLDVADAATATAIQAHVDGLTAKAAEVLTVTTRADEAAGKLAAKLAELDQLKADHAAALEAITADSLKNARARVELETQVSAICGKDWKADGKTDRQCRLDALTALKVEVAADASDDYLRAAIDFAPKGDTKRVTTADVFSAGLKDGVRADAAGPARLSSANLNWE
jgi:hypothetical protein